MKHKPSPSQLNVLYNVLMNNVLGGDIRPINACIKYGWMTSHFELTDSGMQWAEAEAGHRRRADVVGKEIASRLHL
jgi:hypothetical protein